MYREVCWNSTSTVAGNTKNIRFFVNHTCIALALHKFEFLLRKLSEKIVIINFVVYFWDTTKGRGSSFEAGKSTSSSRRHSTDEMHWLIMRQPTNKVIKVIGMKRYICMAVICGSSDNQPTSNGLKSNQSVGGSVLVNELLFPSHSQAKQMRSEQRCYRLALIDGLVG